MNLSEILNLSFQHFGKKGKPHRLSISETIDSKRRGYLDISKVLLQSNLQKSTS